MKNFGTKIDNDKTSAGVVVADEYNSIFSEAKGAVSPFLALNEQDNNQLAKSIDIASKAMFYNDVGTPNAVHLTRGATNEQIETLFDGMVVLFSPANANTGASTLKVNGLPAKAMKYADAVLQANTLLVGVSYIGVYKQSDDSFHIDILTGDSLYYRKSDVYTKEEADENVQSVLDSNGGKAVVNRTSISGSVSGGGSNKVFSHVVSEGGLYLFAVNFTPESSSQINAPVLQTSEEEIYAYGSIFNGSAGVFVVNRNAGYEFYATMYGGNGQSWALYSGSVSLFKLKA